MFLKLVPLLRRWYSYVLLDGMMPDKICTTVRCIL